MEKQAVCAHVYQHEPQASVLAGRHVSLRHLLALRASIQISNLWQRTLSVLCPRQPVLDEALPEREPLRLDTKLK